MIWSDYIYFSWLIQLNLIKGNYYYNTKNLIGSFASSCPPYFNRFKRFFLSLRSSFHFWFCFFFSSSYSSSFSFPSSTSWMLFLFLNFFFVSSSRGSFLLYWNRAGNRSRSFEASICQRRWVAAHWPDSTQPFYYL